MSIILFVISVFSLTLFISWKVWEVHTNRRIFSFKKSDIYFEKKLGFLGNYFNFVLDYLETLGKKIPVLFSRLAYLFSWYLAKLKRSLLEKIVRILEGDKKKKILQNKRSASLYLRSISEDKK